jgi:hypothetical protein
MADKLNSYLDLYNSDVIHKEPWHPDDKKVFPHVLILSELRYGVADYQFKVFQSTSYTQLTPSQYLITLGLEAEKNEKELEEKRLESGKKKEMSYGLNKITKIKREKSL